MANIVSNLTKQALTLTKPGPGLDTKFRKSTHHPPTKTCLDTSRGRWGKKSKEKPIIANSFCFLQCDHKIRTKSRCKIGRNALSVSNL